MIKWLEVETAGRSLPLLWNAAEHMARSCQTSPALTNLAKKNLGLYFSHRRWRWGWGMGGGVSLSMFGDGWKSLRVYLWPPAGAAGRRSQGPSRDATC